MNVIDPDVIFGDLLFPIASLSVAVILFEGGLSRDTGEMLVFTASTPPAIKSGYTLISMVDPAE